MAKPSSGRAKPLKFTTLASPGKAAPLVPHASCYSFLLGESGEIDERSVESSGFSGEENSGLSGDGSGFSGAEESGFSGIESSGLSDIDGSGLSGEEESGLSGDESGFSGEVDASGITDNSGDVIELTDLGSGASGEMPDMVIINQGSGQEVVIVEGSGVGESIKCVSS